LTSRNARYKRTEKGKVANKRYKHSAKGKAAQARARARMRSNKREWAMTEANAAGTHGSMGDENSRREREAILDATIALQRALRKGGHCAAIVGSPLITS
jgi:hypothetical protein